MICIPIQPTIELKNSDLKMLVRENDGKDGQKNKHVKLRKNCKHCTKLCPVEPQVPAAPKIISADKS